MSDDDEEAADAEAAREERIEDETDHDVEAEKARGAEETQNADDHRDEPPHDS